MTILDCFSAERGDAAEIRLGMDAFFRVPKVMTRVRLESSRSGRGMAAPWRCGCC